MEDVMELIVCEGNQHCSWQKNKKQKTVSSQKLIFKRGEQKDVSDAPSITYLTHTKAYLLCKKGTMKRQLIS